MKFGNLVMNIIKKVYCNLNSMATKVSLDFVQLESTIFHIMALILRKKPTYTFYTDTGARSSIACSLVKAAQRYNIYF